MPEEEMCNKSNSLVQFDLIRQCRNISLLYYMAKLMGNYKYCKTQNECHLLITKLWQFN